MPDPRIRIDDVEAQVAAGTSVAAALFMVGDGIARRSVSGEPRAPLCGMGVCHECRVEIDGVAQQRACMISVRDGMRVRTRAPLGAPPHGDDATARSHRRHSDRPPLPTSADVIVIGGGPAGIAAAGTAARSGAEVLLLDENRSPGGQIWRQAAGNAPRAAKPWIHSLTSSGVAVAFETSVADIRTDDRGIFEVLAVRTGVPARIAARQIVLCTGARERFLPFPGWTLPGVVGVGGAQALVKSGAPVQGKRVVIAGTGPLLLAVAASLANAGAQVLLVAEQAPASRVVRYGSGLWRTPSIMVQAAAYRAACRTARYAWGTWVTRAQGGGRVERVTLTDGLREWEVPCDQLCIADGLVPETRLAQLIGCHLTNGAVRVDPLQRTSVPRVWAAGEPTGIGGVAKALDEGAVVGYMLGERDSEARRLVPRLRAHRSAVERLARAFALRDELRSIGTPDTIVCRCEDVRLGDLALADGFRRARVHTRLGMGPCQGRMCGDAMSFLRGWDLERARTPVTPVPLAAFGSQTASSPFDHSPAGA